MNCVSLPDKNQVKRSFSAAAAGYDEFADLQRKVGLALLEKFPVMDGQVPVLDLGCGTGFLAGRMAESSLARPLLAMDIAMPMLSAGREKNRNYAMDYVCADAEKLPFAAQTIGQIYSNLALQWCPDLPSVFGDCRRVLKTGGQLAFATFGPATLRELKDAWAEVDTYSHVNEFIGGGQIECFLEFAGFREVCLESVVYRCDYESVMSLMRELKGIGARNVNMGRNRNVTSRGRLLRMIDCYERAMRGEGVYASYEIAFVCAKV